jgi:hypothetical protein
MTDPRPVHVVIHGDGWAVAREGAERPTSIHYTQLAAEMAGHALARDEQTELVLHSRDGRVRRREGFARGRTRRGADAG